MENDDYLQTTVQDIPFSELEKRVLIYIAEAEIQMGSDFDVRGNKYVIDMVAKEFKHLPLYAIAGAFKKGSLGQYGAGKLVPRTIYGWLSEMAAACFNKTKNIADSIDVKKWDGLLSCPLGSAVCKKIEWYESGLLSIEDWDRVPLKLVADAIGRGEYVTIEKFL